MTDTSDMKGAALALRALKDKNDTGELSGWRKVAVLLISFGEELAAELGVPLIEVYRGKLLQSLFAYAPRTSPANPLPGYGLPRSGICDAGGYGTRKAGYSD